MDRSGSYPVLAGRSGKDWEEWGIVTEMVSVQPDWPSPIYGYHVYRTFLMVITRRACSTSSRASGRTARSDALKPVDDLVTAMSITGGRDVLDAGLLVDCGQRLLGHAPGLKEAREVAE